MRTSSGWVTVLLVLVSVLLIAADRWVSAAPLRTLGFTVFGPLESAAASAVRWPSGTARIEDLERENARLRAALLAADRPSTPPSRTDDPDGKPGKQTKPGKPAKPGKPGKSSKRDKADKTEQASKDGGNDKTAADGYRVVPAHAIGFGREQTVTIDVGSDAGVARDMTVFDSDGLIGRVIQTGPTTATVQLVTSPSASVGARLADSREVGMVTGMAPGGDGQSLLRLSLLNPDASVRVGDRVVTLGSPNLRPYVPDVPIGSVVSVTGEPGAPTRTALVRPFARFTALDLVTVVLGDPGGEPR